MRSHNYQNSTENLSDRYQALPVPDDIGFLQIDENVLAETVDDFFMDVDDEESPDMNNVSNTSESNQNEYHLPNNPPSSISKSTEVVTTPPSHQISKSVVDFEEFLSEFGMESDEPEHLDNRNKTSNSRQKQNSPMHCVKSEDLPPVSSLTQFQMEHERLMNNLMICMQKSNMTRQQVLSHQNNNSSLQHLSNLRNKFKKSSFGLNFNMFSSRTMS